MAVDEVLVVGVGPVGLMAPCELLRRGVRARVVECATVANDKSRAPGVHARTLELLDSMGLAARFVAALTQDADGVTVAQLRKVRLPPGMSVAH